MYKRNGGTGQGAELSHRYSQENTLPSGFSQMLNCLRNIFVLPENLTFYFSLRTLNFFANAYVEHGGRVTVRGVGRGRPGLQGLKAHVVSPGAMQRGSFEGSSGTVTVSRGKAARGQALGSECPGEAGAKGPHT